mmetsp:Transcript_19014/g.55190  ORF Transcript_19014/g.55190 Transcript_19014/m.55190 type:complete len:253 (+) Transcript_19014:1831-2589(+)
MAARPLRQHLQHAHLVRDGLDDHRFQIISAPEGWEGSEDETWIRADAAFVVVFRYPEAASKHLRQGWSVGAAPALKRCEQRLAAPHQPERWAQGYHKDLVLHRRLCQLTLELVDSSAGRPQGVADPGIGRRTSPPVLHRAGLLVCLPVAPVVPHAAPKAEERVVFQLPPPHNRRSTASVRPQQANEGHSAGLPLPGGSAQVADAGRVPVGPVLEQDARHVPQRIAKAAVEWRGHGAHGQVPHAARVVREVLH